MPSKEKGGHQLTFSKKIEMSTEKAKQIMKDNAEKPKNANKRRATGTFISKLYRDEDELNDLKVLGGENFDSDLEDKEATAKTLRKRENKLSDKKDQGAKGSQVMLTAKVGKLVSTLNLK